MNADAAADAEEDDSADGWRLTVRYGKVGSEGEAGGGVSGIETLVQPMVSSELSVACLEWKEWSSYVLRKGCVVRGVCGRGG